MLWGNKILCAKSRPIFTKLGMSYLGLQPIVVCSNDGPRMTLTNFKARSVMET